MTVTNETHPVATTTIQAQIGHRAFVMMGAKNLLAGANSLGWKVGKNAKKVTHVTVALDPSDTYTLHFQRVTKRGLNVSTIAKVSGVYVDSLHRVIEAETGMYLSLHGCK